MSEGSGWQFWIDRGGTFTDVVARSPDGAIRTRKLLSDDPERYEDAAVAAIEDLLAQAPPDARRIAAVKMGTTVGTNALLERTGEPTVLAITAGLRDALRIASQQRPDIFALDIRLPDLLYGHVVEVRERVAATGDVLVPLDADRARHDLAAARRRGFASIAIVLLHGYRHVDHERQLARLAAQAGFSEICVSHEVSPLMKIVERGATTTLDAYLSPVLGRYVTSLRTGLEGRTDGAPLLFMQSHGGLVDAAGFRGKDSVLSGPAGGVVGMAATASAAGYERVIGFDMGGTSTDVALYDGEFERTTDASVAGVRITTPMLRIHTVAAGGGSICKYESARLQAGPESAGAHPGPACYRRGGPLTVTDANLLLGRIQSDYFPSVFGPGGDMPLDTETVSARFAALAAEVSRGTGEHWRPERLAAGFLRIAVERMANAIKQISIERGRDAAEFVLACFGGAGGQHACRVADALGIETVLLHPLAGVLSAFGLGLADLRAVRQRTVEAELGPALTEHLPALAGEMAESALAELKLEHADARRWELRRRLLLKPGAADTALAVDWRPESDTAESLRTRFATEYRRLFGFDAETAVLRVDSIEVEAIARTSRPSEPELPRQHGPPAPCATRRAWFAGEWREVPLFERDSLGAGAVVEGPCIVAEAHATTVLEAGWSGTVMDTGQLRLSRAASKPRSERLGTGTDPVMLEVFNHRFMHIAEQMGLVLRQTAYSVNIKERLDFSCALFDSEGLLIANAPHVPVHLGSMGESVRAVIEANRGAMTPGDSFATNAPYSGGTHLPDVTVVTPIFDARGETLRFVVASRAHHADVGGMSPGSMPAASRRIEEEGVLLENVRITDGGRFLESAARAAFSSGPYPARNTAQNIADLKAQLAANARGQSELARLVERFGLDVVRAYMQHIRDNAELSVREAISRLRDGSFGLELDGGERIAVTVRIDETERTARVDFAGTSAVTPGNMNAPASIARAAVLYVFRCLVRLNVPLNAGCLVPLDIRLPPHSLVNPDYPAAVVAGNVETSQRITDALFGALGILASSQGTMNNLAFGNERYQYYETLCGGAGAGAEFDGASAVHTHMTNSRLTDPEVLEWRFPVRLLRFELRRGSGGRGRHRGGDGMVREYEFLEPVRLSILSNCRRVAPFGLEGGGDGAKGRNEWRRAGHGVVEVGPFAELELGTGDRFVIRTPGGGGYGPPGRAQAQDAS